MRGCIYLHLYGSRITNSISKCNFFSPAVEQRTSAGKKVKFIATGIGNLLISFIERRVYCDRGLLYSKKYCIFLVVPKHVENILIAIHFDTLH